MDVDMLDIQVQNNNGCGTKRRRKRTEHLHDNDSLAVVRDKLSKRILLSLTKPSCVLGLCPKPLRSEHRKRLRYLLRRLIKQHNWVGASGVLSVYLKGTSVSDEFGQSKWLDSAQSHMAESQHQGDSDASVRKDGQISRDVGLNEEDTGASMEVNARHRRENLRQIFQPEGLYLNSEEHTEMGDPFSINGSLTQDALYALEGLDLWLLPLRFSNENGVKDFMYKHGNSNKKYDNAVKYLKLVLDSTPFASAALLPLTQLLLIKGQIAEALTMLEQQCYSSSSVFPIRLRAALFEHFDPNNSLLLHSCFEDVLQKDPRCSDSLAKLIKMHQNGDYSLESLLEMIALHLDATYAEYNIWKMFSSCFYKLSFYETDCISTCSIQNRNRQDQNHFVRKTPKIFTDGVSGKSWRLRCRWWLTRYFNNSKLKSDIEAGDLQLLTYKAACASYVYGQEFSYVGKAYSHLQKENDKDLLLFLDEHKRNSFGFYQIFQKKATCMRS